ncbi:MAG: hypothetical protein HGA67_04000 [Candidatus Yonathbacteria bacterium]|nr:hypothetical protein [Candidatus Yonathbacteria bacterium]
MTEPLTQWNAPEYIQKEHTPDWYWGVGLTAIALIGIAIVMDNTLFAIFIFTATIMVFYFSRRTPNIISFGIYEDKISINNKTLLFREFASFWIREPLRLETDEMSSLIFREKHSFAPLLVIPLPEDIDTKSLRELLSEHMEEETHARHFSEELMDKLGF